MKNKRHCAICGCGSKPAEIYNFDELLRDLEVEGRHAHPSCIMGEQQKRRAEIVKRGVRT